MVCKKIFAKLTTDEGPVPRTYEECLELNNKKAKGLEKNGCHEDEAHEVSPTAVKTHCTMTQARVARQPGLKTHTSKATGHQNALTTLLGVQVHNYFRNTPGSCFNTKHTPTL